MVFGRRTGPAIDPDRGRRRGGAQRFSLKDTEILELARYAVAIEHYGRPMDIEWAKDGVDGRIYVLQARPKRSSRARAMSRSATRSRAARVFVSGRAIGHKIGSGTVRIIPDASQMSRVKKATCWSRT